MIVLSTKQLFVDFWDIFWLEYVNEILEVVFFAISLFPLQRGRRLLCLSIFSCPAHLLFPHRTPLSLLPPNPSISLVAFYFFSSSLGNPRHLEVVGSLNNCINILIIDYCMPVKYVVSHYLISLGKLHIMADKETVIVY